jgi:hypothetical protein
VAFVADTSLLSGFVWPNTQRRLKGSVWAVVETQGRGNMVILRCSARSGAGRRGS